jgi:hypothetical protein
MVLMMARQEAGPCQKWPTTLKRVRKNPRWPKDLVGKLA